MASCTRRAPCAEVGFPKNGDVNTPLYPIKFVRFVRLLTMTLIAIR